MDNNLLTYYEILHETLCVILKKEPNLPWRKVTQSEWIQDETVTDFILRLEDVCLFKTKNKKDNIKPNCTHQHLEATIHVYERQTQQPTIQGFCEHLYRNRRNIDVGCVQLTPTESIKYATSEM